MEQNTCNTCKAYKSIWTQAEIDYEKPTSCNTPNGYCHRHAPRPDTLREDTANDDTEVWAYWPRVRAEDYCLEYLPRPA
jgi:hypothetical protein